MAGIEPYFCTVLGSDTIPAEALKLAAKEKADAKKRAQTEKQGPRYRPPPKVSGQLEPRPIRDSEWDTETDPTIPTHTLRAEGTRVLPNAPCPCGSGRKYKKCCGR